MTALGEPIREVVVAGGGIVGWSAAAALRRRLPWLVVTILPLAPAREALADRIPSTLPSILGFHADLGLRDEDAVIRTGSSFRLGTLFEGWTRGRPGYVHAYGAHGRSFGTTSFHLHWIRAAIGGGAPAFDIFSAAAAMARAGRFAMPTDDADAILGDYEYGLHIDPEHYLRMIRAFALHAGVKERRGDLAAVSLRENGFVDGLGLDDGSKLGGDLFVDCTGPAARVRGCLDAAWEDWRQWLPCDRLLTGEAPPTSDPSPLDVATALPFGWRWTAAGSGSVSHGVVYAAAHASDDEAAGALGVAPGGPPTTFASGTRPQAWLRNCVAIGDAATAIEPLEWCNLHLAHSGIDRLVAMLPDRDCAPVETAEFNRQGAAEAARVRDLLALHYHAADRPEPLWREAASVAPPPTLAHTLTQFRERGRLPVHEEETFARDGWLAVLLGQGVIPRRVDPLVDAFPPAQSERAMIALRDAIAAAVEAQPTHGAFLRAMTRQIAR